MLEPFLKWVGGKRWLVTRYAGLFPSNVDNYVEPFLGSGAVFFWLNPRKAVLSDANPELINTYQVIKRSHVTLDGLLQRFQSTHNKSFYYSMRGLCPTRDQDRAARFLYLNRVCWNGLYRVNRNGDFNVPLGTKTQVSFPPGYLEAVASSLRKAVIRCCDFEESVDRTSAGDFLFVDPPYTVMHNRNNFIKYNDVLFSWHDQIRLAECVKKAHRRGVKLLVSNADHPSVRELYRFFPFHYTLRRTSLLAGDRRARRATTELVVVNYRCSSKSCAW